MTHPQEWVAFVAAILFFLVLDLCVFHRRSEQVSFRQALGLTLFWIGLAAAFNVWVYHARGPRVGLEFLAGYLIEKSLSVDNVFVFLLVFRHFAVPAALQHRVLFWGVAAAILMRGVMIWIGASLLAHFHWVLYPFGLLLVVAGVRMLSPGGHVFDPRGSFLVRALRRVLPVTESYEGQRFLARRGGRLWATPLLLVLLAIESADLVFAVDSIPAVFAVSRDPFVVFTSNVFAILGLRSLYFLLAGMLDRFSYLKLGLAAILIFVGTKMLMEGVYRVSITVSLAVILAILAAAVAASLLRPPSGGVGSPASAEEPVDSVPCEAEGDPNELSRV